jgi:hypothetical protein
VSQVTIYQSATSDNATIEATTDGGASQVDANSLVTKSGLISGSSYYAWRAFVRFFVGLPADATIVAAYLIIKPTARTTGATDPNIQGDYYTHDGSIDTSDWNATVGSLAFTVTQASFTLNADNTLTLSNINNVPKNGYIGLRLKNGTETFGTQSTMTFTPGISSTPSSPRLAVTYHRISAPTNLSPTVPFNRTAIQRFSWTHNDAGGKSQGAFEFQHRTVGAGSWTTVTQTTSNQYYDLPANTYGSSQDIEWRVRTASSDDTATLGPYSSQVTVRAGAAAATPSITAPTGTITNSQPTVTWTSSGQVKYRIRIVKSDGTSTYDSGVVTSTATSVVPSVILEDDTSYTYYLSIVNSDGVTSAEASSVVTTNLTNPATPTIVVTPTASGGYVSIAITNPTPTGGQPNLTENQIYRMVAGETKYTRIAKSITSGATFRDYTAPSNKAISYKVRAVGDNGAVQDSSVSSGNTYTLSGVWLHDVRNAQSTALNLSGFEARVDDNWEPEVILKRYLGREGDVAEWGKAKKKSVKITLEIPTTENKWDSFAALVERRATLCVRTPRGDVYFGVLTARPRSFNHELNNDTVGIDLLGTAYIEEV